MKNRDHGSEQQPTPEPLDFGQSLRELRDQPERVGALLEQFRPYLLTIALGEFPERLQGKLGASDLVQETMLRGLEGFGGFQGASREELAGWLRQILLHHMANMASAFATTKRDVAREVEIDSRIVDAQQASPSVEALSREEWELLRGALERLPEDSRQAVLLRNRENLTFGEIGRLLNRSEEAARKLWCRAIQQLQRGLSGNETRE